LLPKKSIEQMTLVELRDLCKQYQIPSSHANKTKLIERIKQAQNNITNQGKLIIEKVRYIYSLSIHIGPMV
jgi:hypothetical protein